MSYAFISHASLADGQFARRLAGDLRRHGVRYWKAPESIQPGEDWTQAINRALTDCDTMLLVLTPEALASSWVTTETSAGISQANEGKMTFIPLDLKPCQAPPLVRAYQMISFRKDYDAGLRILLRRLGVSPKKKASDKLDETTKYDLRGLLGQGGPPEGKVFNWGELLLGKDAEAKEKPTTIYELRWTKTAAQKEGSPLAWLFEAARKGDEAKAANQHALAIKHYTAAIELYSGLTVSPFLLGSVYHRRGECWIALDFERVQKQFEKDRPARPSFLPRKQAQSLWAHRWLGREKSKEYNSAQADFKKARELGYTPPAKGQIAGSD